MFSGVFYFISVQYDDIMLEFTFRLKVFKTKALNRLFLSQYMFD